MRLEDMLKNVSGITNRVIKENCWEGQFNVLEGIQVLQSKINEIILVINNGIIKGDKGDTPNVQVGETTTLDPGNKASVTQTGDMLNPIFNFAIPKGDKGDKGDTGKASESIQDNVVGLDTCWSSQKTVGYVDNMFNSLQDVKGVNYATDKEYFVASGSKNGVVKDLKIKGKSLVNIFSYGGIKLSNGIILDGTKLKWDITNQSWIYASKIISNIKPNTIYTLICDIGENTLNNEFILMDSSLNNRIPTKNIVIPIGSKNRKVVTTFNSKDNVNANEFMCQCQANTTGIIELSNIMILEGDHTQNPPHYFEGIASVGNGNEIEVSCVNENLFDGELRVAHLEGGTYIYREGIANTLSAIVKIVHGGTYSCKCVGGNRNSIAYFKDNPKPGDTPLKSGLDTITVDSGGYLVFYMTNQSNVEYPKNIMVNFGSVARPYVSHKQDKKPILFKDTDGAWKPITELRGIDLNICDNIENGVFNKLLSLETVSDKNTFTLRSQDGGTLTNCFEVNEPLSNCNISDTNFIGLCDKFKTYNWTGVNGLVSSDEEGVTILSNKKIRFRILKSKANTVEELKSYLINNNFNILRLLENKLTYEVNPIDLQSFENETMILFKYGIVNGSTEFYVDSNLGSITIENMERLSRIENEIYQVKKVVLNGDYRTLAQSTYPEDFKEVVKYE